MAKNKKSASADPPPQHFGARLRQLRLENQLNQGALAEKCNISPAYLSDIERGKRNPPNDQTILAWARLLNLSKADEIGDELLTLAARDRDRVVVETEVEMVAPGGHHRPPASPKPQAGQSATPFLDHFGTDLVQQAAADKLDPAAQPQQIFIEIAAALARRRTNSALLQARSSGQIVQAVHGLANALADGDLPAPLAKMRLLSINGLQAGVKYRGQLEERLATLLREAEESGPLLLHFHSLADLVDLENAANGSYFAPTLLEGRVHILTGARPDELAYSRKVNAGLVEAFRTIDLPPLEKSQILRGLFSLRPQYQNHHQLSYTDDALEAIATWSAGGETESAWQRALDLLDEIGARQRLDGSDAPISAETISAALEKV